MNSYLRLFSIILLSILMSACAGSDAVKQTSQTATTGYETEIHTTEIAERSNQLPSFEPVPAGEFDNGRMWTFEYPPTEYFSETYGFEATKDWFEKARLGSVRLPNCSGSFVSAYGLVMTNHHCVREEISQIGKPGEELLDNGFYAVNLSDERRIDDYYIDQLIRYVDITDLIFDEVDLFPLEEQAAVRQDIIAEIQQDLQEAADADGLIVQVVYLYNGGRYSAYYFKRYDDIRMVMAPELQIGYYGGDDDNFTYPRYNLDMAFFRVYEDDKPLNSEHFFPFASRGVEAGDAVFLTGNPGRTTRQQTVAQLTYRGIYSDKYRHNLIARVINGLEAYYEFDPVEAEERDLRNFIFALKNAEKFYGGQVEALQNPELLGRRVYSENEFKSLIDEDDELAATYLPLFDEIEAIQYEKMKYAATHYPSLGISPGSTLSPTVLQRALMAFVYGYYFEMGVSAEDLSGYKQQIFALEDFPSQQEKLLLTQRIELFRDILGDEHDIVVNMLGGRTASEIAKDVVENSVLANSDRIGSFFEGDILNSSDPAMRLVSTFAPVTLETQELYTELNSTEAELLGQLGRARYAVFGTSIPPDATFSLRIADGVVAGYPYNGTIAPAYTTFYGLYDRAHSHHSDPQWALPDRWKKPSVTLDLGTPLNFVSTNDIIGGNSGSPVLNINLEVVGLAFDSNIEGMGSNDFILDSERARAVSVDSRGMIESLRHVYKADRLVRELTGARN